MRIAFESGLEQIAARARAQSREHVLVRVVRREHQRRRLDARVARHARYRYSVEAGHAYVEQRDLRAQGLYPRPCGFSVGVLPDDLEVRLLGEIALHALSRKRMVVG